MEGTVYAIAGLVALGAILFMLERLIPLRRSRARLVHRLLINFAVSTLAFGAAFAVVNPAAIATLSWTSGTRVGLLHFAEIHPVVRLGIGFLLMDLLFYYWHQLNHRIPLLWRFHNVHHVDPDLDVSTAFRFHFGEVAISAAFRVVQILVVGPSLWTYVVYEVVFQANTLFHHSNVRLPLRVERPLNRVLVTPRMHGIHHSQIRRESRSNYGVVFPWWDRIHRTLVLNIPQSEITAGIAGYSLPGDNGVRRTLWMPFGPQRDYWRRADGKVVERDGAPLEPNPSRMAE